jgi:hypothetical protein
MKPRCRAAVCLTWPRGLPYVASLITPAFTYAASFITPAFTYVASLITPALTYVASFITPALTYVASFITPAFTYAASCTLPALTEHTLPLLPLAPQHRRPVCVLECFTPFHLSPTQNILPFTPLVFKLAVCVLASAHAPRAPARGGSAGAQEHAAPQRRRLVCAPARARALCLMHQAACVKRRASYVSHAARSPIWLRLLVAPMVEIETRSFQNANIAADNKISFPICFRLLVALPCGVYAASIRRSASYASRVRMRGASSPCRARICQRVHMCTLLVSVYARSGCALPCRVYIGRNEPLQSAYRPARSHVHSTCISIRQIWLCPTL